MGLELKRAGKLFFAPPVTFKAKITNKLGAQSVFFKLYNFQQTQVDKYLVYYLYYYYTL